MEQEERSIRMEVFKAILAHHAGQTIVPKDIIGMSREVADFIVGKDEKDQH